MSSSSQVSFPPTSLIICSRNRPTLLLEAIESVLHGNEIPTELIIIDQSNIPHQALANLKSDRACEIRYFWVQSVGLSRANNYGIAAARHDLLVFTHDDVLATPTWLSSLVRPLIIAGPRAVVTGRVPPTTVEAPGVFAPSTKSDEVPAVYEGRIGADVLFPMSMAMHRAIVAEIGKFDERLGPGTPFPAAEDNDFALRLLEAGCRIIYVPEAVLYHRAWRAEREYLPLRWSYGRGQGAYYAKHLSLWDRYMLGRVWKDIRRHIFRVPRRIWRQPRLGCGDLIYVLGILSGAAQWLLTQRRGVGSASIYRTVR